MRLVTAQMTEPPRKPSEGVRVPPYEFPASSRFLRLPRELRDKIYKHALIADQAFLWPAESYTRTHHFSPNLLSTCRQVYDEAAPIIYKLNRFTFSHPSDCNVFRRIMDNRHCHHITSVAFRVRDKERDVRLWTSYFESVDPIRSLTTDLPHLRYLVVFLRQSWWNPRLDADENMKGWPYNHTLKRLCNSLNGRTTGEVTVVCSLRIPEAHFEHLKRASPQALIPHGSAYVRTKAIVMLSASVVLELLSPHASIVAQPITGPG